MGEGYIWTFTVCGVYQVTHYIGGGAGGDVARAFNMLTGDEVAVKMESLHVEHDTKHPPVLAYEAAIYKLLGRPTIGFPSLHWAGKDSGNYILILEKLGPNLASLFKFCRHKFSPRTVCMLAQQMLARIEYVHSRGLLVVDVKPQNFAIGMGDNAHVVYLFDFGHSKLFLDPATGEHRPYTANHSATGTVVYASIAAHRHYELCRRDDIEALFYVLVEFCCGELPWQGIYAPSYKAKLERTRDMKAGSVFRDFIAARCPPEFQAYYSYYTNLMFTQEPNYAYLKGLFADRMKAEGWDSDAKFDWMDPSLLEKGTLMPEEYVVDSRFVEDIGIDPA
ncbi:kinase-like protein [Ganoderma leucocontextum]|nr:kinase-like protein [Ganoderma leucocontextum]